MTTKKPARRDEGLIAIALLDRIADRLDQIHALLTARERAEESDKDKWQGCEERERDLMIRLENYWQKERASLAQAGVPTKVQAELRNAFRRTVSSIAYEHGTFPPDYLETILSCPILKLPIGEGFLVEFGPKKVAKWYQAIGSNRKRRQAEAASQNGAR